MRFSSAPVGDKFVAEEMAKRGAMLGGEQSGHVILAEHSTTGDGILAGLELAQIAASGTGRCRSSRTSTSPIPRS